jgi:two-component system response regulator AtoC
VLERAIVMTEGDCISAEFLPEELFGASSKIQLKIPESRVSMKSAMKELTEMAERTLISRALQQTSNNRTRAAKLLEISHRALMYKIKEYGL